MFCGCGGFRFSVRVIYGAAVFISSADSSADRSADSSADIYDFS